MLLYLFALEDNGSSVLGENARSAGVQYFPARSPVLNTNGRLDAEQAAEERGKQWKRKGLILCDKDVLNAMEFDVTCLGNHEFDNGMEELARRLRNLKVPVVCANYDFTGSPIEGLVKPYVILEKAGKKIGVIGLLTDVTSVVNVEIANSMKYSHPVGVTNRLAEELKVQKGCDLVVCLTHLGFEGEDYNDTELAAKVRYVDVIVGGHSHTHLDDLVKVADLDGVPVTIVTDGKWGLDIGNLKVSFTENVIPMTGMTTFETLYLERDGVEYKPAF
jgi:2',3'-cyclic-nucleotide 2'-phosphodiesterase (5'-nucleotidase family)